MTRLLLSLASGLLLLSGAAAFLPAGSRLQPTPTRPAALGRPRSTTTMLAAPGLEQGLELAQTASSLLLAYTDDSKASLNTEIGVISFAGAAAGLTALFFLLTKNLKGKSFSFALDEAEQAAVDAVTAIFDNEESLALTEAGTVGFVARKKLAEQAKKDYQKGKDEFDVRDKTLYYAEVDLSFLATLLRAAQPQGGVFYDLGSGVGRACMAAGKLYKWKKVVGVEYLAGLHKEAQRYLGKYRGGSPVTLVNKDFVDVSLADADVVFLYATKYSPAEVQQVLSTVPVGARVISLDRTLNQRSYKLLKTVEDPAGDLQRVSGYVYEKVA